MINNSDTVKEMKIDHRVCEKYLSNHVLYNRYFIRRMSLVYFFRWSYRNSNSKTVSFEANLVERG